MKKVSSKTQTGTDSMQAEYNFTGGTRGKHYRAMQAGYTITIKQANGTKVVKEVRPHEGGVVLAPDVREYFPDSESVNTALRSLIKLIPRKRHPPRKKVGETETKSSIASDRCSTSTSDKA